MTLNPKRTSTAASAAATAFGALLNGGYLRLYDGTQPATADTAIGTATLLAELRFATPAFGAASDGVVTATGISDDTDCNETGDATWFRALGSDGTTKVYDGSVGTADADLIVATVSIVAHATFSVPSLTLTELK